MVSSVQRTEVADVASLFIGCDMKKRSACNILTGIIALGGISHGQCGQITLKGGVHRAVVVQAEVSGLNPLGTTVPYDIVLNCAVCENPRGPCLITAPRDIRVKSRMNVRDIAVTNAGPAGVPGGRMVTWRVTDPERDNSLSLEFKCDTSSRRDWTWISSRFSRKTRVWNVPQSDIHVTATNLTTGQTATHTWTTNGGGEWNPQWTAWNAGGGPEGGATVRVTYPEKVELRGKRSRARILYDVVGTAPVTAQIDKLPPGLSCERTSDGLIIMSGVTADVGTGDSITCTNVRDEMGTTTASLSVDVMIR